MKVFISWSGDPAKEVAEKLRTWLPTVLAGNVQCFVSSQDIRRGERGLDVIAAELQDRDYGIVVLTKDNMSSPWVNFEAGALGKSLGAGKVAPLLLDVTRADVEGPVAQFQNTLLTDRDDMLQFVRDMALLTPGVPEDSVVTLFDAKWGELEQVVEHAAGLGDPVTTRSVESMLEEVLEHVRSLRKGGPMSSSSSTADMRTRSERLALLDKRYGGTWYHVGDTTVEVADYKPDEDVVLVPRAHGQLVWEPVNPAAVYPF